MFRLMNDDQQKRGAFDKALDLWRVNTPLPPRFQEQVWRKIESAQVQPRVTLGQVIARWLETVVPRRAVAASYVGIFLVVGLVAGTWQAKQHNAEAEQAFARKYVQSVDPYQAPRI